LAAAIGVLPALALRPLYVGSFVPQPALVPIVVLACQAVLEEVLRAVFQAQLERPLGGVGAWLAATFLWAAIHLPRFLGREAVSPPTALYECAIRVPSGLFYGLLFVRSRSVLPPALAHLMCNYWVSDY
jgi:membrane protease YdiL (CAAX protease family)